jgi:murein DD-endopeptidase MepM/ murein hydrolase activator NlpD
MTRYAHVFRLFTAPFIAAALMLFLLPIRCFAVTQEELENIEAQREVLETRRDNIEKKVSDLSASHASALEQKAALDERNQITLKQIKLLMDQIDLCDTILKQKEKEVEAAKQKETEQLEKFRARVRGMEENENYSILDLLLTSSSIGEFISAMEDMQVIVESDKKLADDYIAAREEAERVRNEYLSVKNEYKEHLDVLNAEQGKLERQIAEADALIISLEEDTESAIAEYEISIASEDKMAKYLDEMSLQYAHEQDAELRGVYSDSQFIWPVPSCTLLTSPYGYRIHPILDYERLHAGLDIGAKFGEEIIAADGGTVLIAEYSDSYGNFVLIDHGDRYSTAYGHMSEIAVEAGQEVKQGELIGYIGSTGWSTGPHLHFEIRLDGERIDPEEFFSGLIHYNC